MNTQADSVTEKRATDHAAGGTTFAPATQGAGGSDADAQNSQDRSVAKDLTFGGALKSEVIKLFSLRSIRWTIAVSLGFGILSAVFAVWAISSGLDGAEAGPMLFTVPASLGTMFLALIFGVFGVLSVTNEYSSGMIISSLVAAPKRGLLISAKLVCVLVVSAVLAAIYILCVMVTAGLFESSFWSELGSATLWTAVLGNFYGLVCMAVLAFGLGALLRSSAGAITIVVGIVFVLPIVLQVMMTTGWEWVNQVSLIVPQQLLQVLGSGNEQTQQGPASWMTWYVAFAVLAAWVVVAVIPGIWRFLRSDAK
jgi:ABC-2 type transport system permease protein